MKVAVDMETVWLDLERRCAQREKAPRAGMGLFTVKGQHPAHHGEVAISDGVLHVALTAGSFVETSEILDTVDYAKAHSEAEEGCRGGMLALSKGEDVVDEFGRTSGAEKVEDVDGMLWLGMTLHSMKGM